METITPDDVEQVVETYLPTALAALDLLDGDYETAIERATRGIRMAFACGWKLGIARGFHVRGLARQAQGDHQGARQDLEAAVTWGCHG